MRTLYGLTLLDKAPFADTDARNAQTDLEREMWEKKQCRGQLEARTRALHLRVSVAKDSMTSLSPFFEKSIKLAPHDSSLDQGKTESNHTVTSNLFKLSVVATADEIEAGGEEAIVAALSEIADRYFTHPTTAKPSAAFMIHAYREAQLFMATQVAQSRSLGKSTSRSTCDNLVSASLGALGAANDINNNDSQSHHESDPMFNSMNLMSPIENKQSDSPQWPEPSRSQLFEGGQQIQIESLEELFFTSAT